jgi:voltage-gated potassium channel
MPCSQHSASCKVPDEKPLTAMPIYRVQKSGFGQLHSREWRRRVLRTVVLLLLVVAVCALGLIALDSTGLLLTAKISRGLWNALNMVTTLGAFTTLDSREKLFMMATMVAFMMISGYALSSLTGILSSEAIMSLRENRNMEHKLEDLANHVIVIGFGTLGRLAAGRLHDAGETVVVIDRSEELAVEASSLGYLVVQGDAGADDAVFEHSRVDHAKALVVTTVNPDRKLSITLMAHSRNPNLKIAVTGANSSRGALLHHAGASEVVIIDELLAGALVDRLKA